MSAKYNLKFTGQEIDTLLENVQNARLDEMSTTLDIMRADIEKKEPIPTTAGENSVAIFDENKHLKDGGHFPSKIKVNGGEEQTADANNELNLNVTVDYNTKVTNTPVLNITLTPNMTVQEFINAINTATTTGYYLVKIASMPTNDYFKYEGLLQVKITYTNNSFQSLDLIQFCFESVRKMTYTDASANLYSGAVRTSGYVTSVTAVAGAHIDQYGTPTVSAVNNDGALTLTFDYLRGQGLTCETDGNGVLTIIAGQ